MSQTALVSISVAVTESNLGQGKDLSILQVAMRQGGEDKARTKEGRLKQKPEEPCCQACFQTLVAGFLM